jgi:hypothetical protein
LGGDSGKKALFGLIQKSSDSNWIRGFDPFLYFSGMVESAFLTLRMDGFCSKILRLNIDKGSSSKSSDYANSARRGAGQLGFYERGGLFLASGLKEPEGRGGERVIA